MDRFSGSKSKKVSSPQEKNIQVVVRCRPRNNVEKKSGSPSVIEANTKRGEIIVHQELHDKPITKTFGFDKVYNADSTQIEVYQGVVEPIIAEVLMGYNCTVFAYGQTSTGKTYTMEGERSSEGSLSWEEDPLAGIIPRSLHQLFRQLDCQENEYSVRVSFLELYNEELFDLLSTSNDQQKLRIFDDSARKGGVVVQGLEEVTVHSKDEVYSILDRGRQRRQTACTLMNASSSRSHTVFSVTIHIKESSMEGEELLKTGKLNLVDLAGSENISRSGAADKRAKEAGSINQSLLTLGRCITALVEKCPHIPYRESKLTRILQDSLGGRTKTSIVATISPALCNLDETMSTLDYAHRAKNITNRPEINQKLTKKALIKEYTGEIDRLKKDLLAAREKNGIFLSPENYYGMETKIKFQAEVISELEDKIKSCSEEIKKLEEMFSCTKEELEEKEKELTKTSQVLEDTQSSLTKTKQNLAVVKKERDETKYLVSEHVRSEEMLRDEAEQLKSTVETAVSDVTGLHNKLSRVTDIESSNRKTATQFKEVYNTNVDAMRASLKELKLQQTDFTQSLLESIKCLSSSHCESVQHIQQLVHDIQFTVNCSTQQQIALTKERLGTNTEMVAKLSPEQFEIDLSKACNVMLVNQLTPLLSDLHESVTRHTSSYKSLLTSLKDKIVDYDETVAQFESCQLSHLKEMESKIEMSQQEQAKEIDGICGIMDNVLAEQHMAHQEIFNDMADKVNQWMDSAKQTLSSQWEMKMSKMKEKLQNYVASQEEKTCSLKQSVSGVSNGVSSFASTSNCILSNTIGEIDTLLTNVEFNETTEKELLTKTQFGINSGLNSVKEIASQFSKVVKVHSSSLASGLEEQCNMSTETSVNHCKDMRALTDGVSSQMTSLLADKMSSISCEWEERIDDHSGKFSEGFERSDQKLNNLKELVENFVSTELKEDIPTGMTPQRRQFAYPRVLTQTKPHPELLKEFWEKLEQVEEVDETPEKESEIESSISSTSSWSSTKVEEETKENVSKAGKRKKTAKGSPLQTLNIQ